MWQQPDDDGVVTPPPAKDILKPSPACSFDGCSFAPITRKYEYGGHISLCHRHYLGMASKEAAKWLFDRGVISNEMTTAERMAALAAYRKKLASTPRPLPSQDWAEKVMRLAVDTDLPMISVQWATELLENRSRIDLEGSTHADISTAA